MTKAFPAGSAGPSTAAMTTVDLPPLAGPLPSYGYTSSMAPSKRSASRAPPATAWASPPRSPRPGSGSSKSTALAPLNVGGQGKTDQLDAYRAARSVLTGEASTDPKSASIEPLRALTVTRRSAVKAQQAAWRQIGALLVNAPTRLRDRYRELPEAKLVAILTNTRPDQQANPDLADTMHALRALARRHRDLGQEIADLQARMAARATSANPALLAMKGVGPVIGAQLLITAGDNPDRLRSSASFAALCGTAPIPVSSGRTDRHRLSRGGDRQANAALHHNVKVRLSYDPATRAYRDAHLAKGWSAKAVFRALKRAVAREVFQALAGHCAVPDYSDLRPARQAKNLTLTAAAHHLGVWPARDGELELGPELDLLTRLSGFRGVEVLVSAVWWSVLGH